MNDLEPQEQARTVSATDSGPYRPTETSRLTSRVPAFGENDPRWKLGVCDLACEPGEIDPECDYHNGREVPCKRCKEHKPGCLNHAAGRAYCVWRTESPLSDYERGRIDGHAWAQRMVDELERQRDDARARAEYSEAIVKQYVPKVYWPEGMAPDA